MIFWQVEKDDRSASEAECSEEDLPPEGNLMGPAFYGLNFSLLVEEPVHTRWSRFCTVNHWAFASNYQLSNMKRPGQDSNRQPQRLKASTNCYTTEPPNP